MKKGAIWTVLTGLILTSLVLSSCSTSTSATKTTQPTSASTTTATSTIISPTKTVTSTTATTTTAATTGNWWDSLGKPQYGGTMTIRVSQNIVDFDPINGNRLANVETAWIERMFADDWTLNPSICNYQVEGRDSAYVKGLLAASWEFADTSTFVVHLRQGIHWQNIAPANGRELVASDVVYHYDRMLGLGGGFTAPATAYAGFVPYKSLVSVNATDKYSIAFKWNLNNPEFILETMERIPGADVDIECPEAVQQWGNLNDWRHAIGTGPFILQNFVDGSSATCVKNTTYWGHDERYPQNQLPYVDELNILIIPDNATALSALRTGKIDVIEGIQPAQAQSLQKTNPELLQLQLPAAGYSVDPRNDVKPFNDIRVREAMQMAIDLPTIAKTYYLGTADPYPDTMPSRYEAGWCFQWEQWPQTLKDQYTYNPTAAKQLLAQAGYPNGFNTDVVADIASDIDLLQIVKGYFSNVGINMDIRTMDSTSWQGYLNAGKQDQMSYRNGSILGSTDTPLLDLQSYLPGYSANWLNVNDPVYNAFYPNAMAATTVDQVKKIVSDASEYISQQHFAISLIQPNLFGVYQPWLKGYNGQNQAITGLVTPRLLDFYEARFWIDQNLKKTLVR